MGDMREYKEAVRNATQAEKNNDKNWTWKVKAINKGKAKISWGYLDYLGETDCFEVEIMDDETTPAVIGKMPNGEKVYAFIGESRWDDAKTFESGIEMVIHRMAVYAHSIY